MIRHATERQIEDAYTQAAERYAALGVDADQALERLAEIALSLHCWQGDDVGGFENEQGLTGAGLAVTGNYPGRARTPDELRADLEKTFDLIPGNHRLSLHAMYAETGGARVDRDELQPEHFAAWMDWAQANDLSLDLNGTFFSHPRAQSGFTLSSDDESVREFWIAHAIACRRIGAEFGRRQGNPCITNLWIPDGSKDMPVDRKGPRIRLKESLDEIYATEMDQAENLDAVEGKLFGIGSECYVVGSHEFYLGYAVENGLLLCLDAGHYHPTEVLSDKISAVMTFLDEILLHVTRGVRWDSDHVVTLNDEIVAIAQELVRGDYLERTHIGLDFFDASINRVAAWVIGARATLKALLVALLEPTPLLRRAELSGDNTARLALTEEFRLLPAGAVWDYYCLRQNVPVGPAWLDEVRAYEKNVLSRRK